MKHFIKGSFWNIGKIVFLPALIGVLATSCYDDDDIASTFNIVKHNPSGHKVDDGSLKLVFLNKKNKPEIIWSKDVYSFYKEVSSEYSISGLSSGMYRLEIKKSQDSSIFEYVYLASYDTIFPGPYFPIWPGSYWIYDSSDTIECFEDYKLLGLGHLYTGLSQTHGPHNQPAYPIDSVYVPSIKSAHYEPMDFYHYSIALGDELMRFIPIVDEEEDFYFRHPVRDDRYDDYYTSAVIKVDTSLQIGSRLYENVIIAEHYYLPNMVGDFRTETWRKMYFASDIGLVKCEAKVYVPGSDYEIVTINLTDYYINKE